MIDLQDNNILFKRIQPQMQKQAMLIAEKISRKKIEVLARENQSKLNAIEEQQQLLIKELASKSQQAMLKGMLGGAALGSIIAIAASFIL